MASDQIADDLSDMLTVIAGYSELVLEDLPPCDPHRPMLERIRRAALRSNLLAEQLLTTEEELVQV